MSIWIWFMKQNSTRRSSWKSDTSRKGETKREIIEEWYNGTAFVLIKYIDIFESQINVLYLFVTNLFVKLYLHLIYALFFQ